MRPFRRGLDVRVSLSDLQDELNHVFNRLWHGGIATGPLDGQEWAPKIDLLDHEDRYTILAEIPGVRADDIDVSVSGDAVTIKGHKPAPTTDNDTKEVVFSEIRSGSFCREVTLQEEVRPEDIQAISADGVLTVTLPKAEGAKPKAIRVEVKPS